MPEATLDPAKYEIFYNRIIRALSEAKESVRRISASVITRDAGEVAEGLYSKDGETVAMATGLIVHCNTISRAIKYMIEDRYEEDVGFYDGDQFINNDAHIGGVHIPDMILPAPLWYDGKHIGWVGCFTHVPEVGAIDPGGISPRATEFWHEGLCLPCVKIVEKGKLRRDIFQMMYRAVREHRALGIDTRAKIAGNERAKKRIIEIIDDVGLDFYLAATEQMLKEGEEQARAKIKKLQPGIYRSRFYTDYIGGFDEGLGIEEFEMEITKEGTMSLNLPVVSPQRNGCNNAALPTIEATTFGILMEMLFYDVRWNGGTMKAYTLNVPENSMVNASKSAAIGMGSVHVGLQCMMGLAYSLSQAFYASKQEDEILLGGSLLDAPVVAGIDQFGRGCATMITDTCIAGMGARHGQDGVDSGLFIANPWSDGPDVEANEAATPILYLGRNHVPDSGGFGKYRGGTAIESMYFPNHTPYCVLASIGSGRRVSVFQGMYGGYPPPCTSTFLSQDNDLFDRIKEKKPIPHTADEMKTLVNGKYSHLPASFSKTEMKEGDIFCMSTIGKGGAGLGDPIEREPDSIVQDIEGKKTTLRTARKIYCIAVDPDTMMVDYEKTKELREEKIKERLKQGIPAREYLKEMIKRRKDRNLSEVALDFFDELKPFSPRFVEELEFEERFAREKENPKEKSSAPKNKVLGLTPYVDIVEDGSGKKWTKCSICEHEYSGAEENYKLYALVYDRDPKEILPGNLGPEKDWMIYREFYCPGCGAQIDVEATAPGTPILHNIEIKF